MSVIVRSLKLYTLNYIILPLTKNMLPTVVTVNPGIFLYLFEMELFVGHIGALYQNRPLQNFCFSFISLRSRYFTPIYY